MPSPFANAQNALLAALDQAAGESIVYTRGNDSVDLTAATGRTAFDAFDAEGFTTTVRSKDWIFPAAELTFDLGVTSVEPAEGDVVRWTDADDTVHVFRVLPFGTGKEIFRYCGGAQSRIRVHTKRMSTE